MGAPGLEPAVEQTRNHRGTAPLRAGRTMWLGGRWVFFQDLPQRYGLAPPGTHRHPVAGLWVAIDRLVDQALGPVRRPPREGQVAALQRSRAAMVGELSGKRPMGAVVLGDHHQA